MLGALLDRFRPDPLRVRVEDSIRRGTGLFKHEWLIGTGGPIDAPEMQRLADGVVEWCRDRMSETRRPYGIDQMALAVACAVPGGRPLASTTFGVFRPVDFYTEGGVASRVEAYLHSLALVELNRQPRPLRFAAALFSWGDVARDTVFSEQG